ncbi:MAG TPA: HAD-IA family hydrolase [Acidimicrobiia bacterium]|nr:HAD-IA family hydrolase [Acidimicrobiia bacterium]
MRLLLDLGGVVIRTPFEMLGKIGDPGWTGPFDPNRDHLWQALQRGEISERTYWYRRARQYLPNGGISDEEALQRLFRDLLDHPEGEVVRPEVAALVRTVPRPAALTNDMAHFHSPAWVNRMTVLGYFDPLIDLSHQPFLKPDRRAFEMAVGQLEVPPAEVLFVDDQPQNLAGAAAVGMNTLWFDVRDVTGSVAQIEAELHDR